MGIGPSNSFGSFGFRFPQICFLATLPLHLSLRTHSGSCKLETLQSLGFFTPDIYLPIYERTMGFPFLAGTLTVALFNTNLVFAVILLGALIDNLHVTTAISISMSEAALSVYLLWGFAESLPVLCLFNLILHLRVIRWRVLGHLAGHNSLSQGQKCRR